MGNVQICKFLVEQASPKELDVLQFIIEDRDRLNMTPLMLLCQRGYKQSFNEMEQRVERRRAQIIEILLPKEKSDKTRGKDEKNYAKWSNVSNQTGYNVFHWLAYYNDTESLFYLLNLIENNAKNF
jgi:ankyrin repeat protein